MFEWLNSISHGSFGQGAAKVARRGEEGITKVAARPAARVHLATVFFVTAAGILAYSRCKVQSALEQIVHENSQLRAELSFKNRMITDYQQVCIYSQVKKGTFENELTKVEIKCKQGQENFAAKDNQSVVRSLEEIAENVSIKAWKNKNAWEGRSDDTPLGPTGPQGPRPPGSNAPLRYNSSNEKKRPSKTLNVNGSESLSLKSHS